MACGQCGPCGPQASAALNFKGGLTGAFSLDSVGACKTTSDSWSVELDGSVGGTPYTITIHIYGYHGRAGTFPAFGGSNLKAGSKAAYVAWASGGKVQNDFIWIAVSGNVKLTDDHSASVDVQGEWRQLGRRSPGDDRLQGTFSCTLSRT